MIKPPCVYADWDAEARVWVATSNDVPGLATEAETVEQLWSKLEIMVPELLTENESGAAAIDRFELIARRHDSIRTAA